MTQDVKRRDLALASSEDTHTQPAATASHFRVRAYPVALRLLAAVLTVAAGISMPAILAAVLLASDPPITPPILWRMFAVMTLAPTLGAWLIRRIVAAEADVQIEHLVLGRQGLRIEVPAEAIADVRPWMVPLPDVGFSLRLRSGRRFKYGLNADDATGLLRALAERGNVAPAAVAARHTMVVYADARRSTAGWRWYHRLFKFALFALLPTLVLFNAHQYIAYGGTFGQYYLEGLGPYVASFAEHWITVVIYLVLYAAIWRGIAEAVASAAAFVVPRQALAARRAVEVVARIAYYGGVPVLLALRFAG
jgi:hypothetical protein